MRSPSGPRMPFCDVSVDWALVDLPPRRFDAVLADRPASPREPKLGVDGVGVVPHQSRTFAPPENIESWTSNSAGGVPGGTPNAAWAWMELPGLMSPVPLFAHIPAVLLASYSGPE